MSTSPVRISVSIDGHDWSGEQLDRLQHQRHLHVLHTMVALGAPITHEGRSLGSAEIDALTPHVARQLSIGIRGAYDIDGITTLFRDQLRASDALWKQAVGYDAHAPLRAAVTDIEVQGMSLDDLGAHAADPAAVEHNYRLLNPDHYVLRTEDGRSRAMETFGMHANPTDMYITVDPDVRPVSPDLGYHRLTSGFTTLASDGTDIRMYAFHQVKPTSDGFAVKLGAYFPPGTPADIVEGHKLHMAIEFRELCLLATQSPRV